MSMLEQFDQYFLDQPEPQRSCLLALRSLILDFYEPISPSWKYRMPFFCIKGKMFCYLWVDKKTKDPYIGFVNGGLLDHPMLEKGNRSRMKILRVDPSKDLPVELIVELLERSLEEWNK